MGLTFIEWLRIMKQIDKKYVYRHIPVQFKIIKIVDNSLKLTEKIL